MKRSLILLVLVFISSANASSFGQSIVNSEFVKLKGDDGITLHGVLWSPASGKARIGIVIAPGGGSEFYNDLLVWLGEHFARSGYIALTMNRRDHGSEQWYHNFEPSAMDHKYMIDFLAARGAQVVILAGHSYGTVTAPYYLMASDDSRVKAIILYGAHGYKRDGLTRAFASQRSEEHTSELQSLAYLVCRLLLEKKNP